MLSYGAAACSSVLIALNAALVTGGSSRRGSNAFIGQKMKADSSDDLHPAVHRSANLRNWMQITPNFLPVCRMGRTAAMIAGTKQKNLCYRPPRDKALIAFARGSSSANISYRSLARFRTANQIAVALLGKPALVTEIKCSSMGFHGRREPHQLCKHAIWWATQSS